jgi:hypothetical protein
MVIQRMCQPNDACRIALKLKLSIFMRIAKLRQQLRGVPPSEDFDIDPRLFTIQLSVIQPLTKSYTLNGWV